MSEHSLAAVLAAQLLGATNGLEPGPGVNSSGRRTVAASGSLAPDAEAPAPFSTLMVGLEESGSPGPPAREAALADAVMPAAGAVLHADLLAAEREGALFATAGTASGMAGAPSPAGASSPASGEAAPVAGNALPLPEAPLDPDLPEGLRAGSIPAVPEGIAVPATRAGPQPVDEPALTAGSAGGPGARGEITLPRTGPPPPLPTAAGEATAASPGTNGSGAQPEASGAPGGLPSGRGDRHQSGAFEDQLGLRASLERGAARAGETDIRGQTIRFDRLDPPASQVGLAGQPAPGPASPNPPGGLILRGDPALWPEIVAQRLVGLVGKGVNTADLKLNPPRLGHLEIRIAIHNDQASVWLSSGNPEVRDALQLAMPRLDGLLQELGIQLVESEVTEERLDRHAGSALGGRSEGSDADERSGPAPDEAAGGADDRAPAMVRSLSILDTWA